MIGKFSQDLIDNENYTLLINKDNESMINGTDPRLTGFDESNNDPTYVLIPMTTVYILILATSVIGNFSTCVVIFCNKYMHTATNYYLFSLAVSDCLLVISGVPKEVHELWFRYKYIFGETSCMMQGFLSETAANATVLTITAFTVERYIAICHPFLSHTVSKLSRALKHIVIIWILAAGFAFPQAIQFGIQISSNPANNAMQRVECTVLESTADSFVISSLLFFVIPMVLISVLYILIGLRLRSSRMMDMKQSSTNSNKSMETRVRKNQARVVRMLIAVVVAFVTCWAPFHAQRLLALYGKSSSTPIEEDSLFVYVYKVLTYISGIFYFLSTAINPFLYNIMSHRFRHAFKVTFGSCCGCKILRRRRSSGLTRTRSDRINNHLPSTPSSGDSLPREVPPCSKRLLTSLSRQNSRYSSEPGQSQRINRVVRKSASNSFTNNSARNSFTNNNNFRNNSTGNNSTRSNSSNNSSINSGKNTLCVKVDVNASHSDKNNSKARDKSPIKVIKEQIQALDCSKVKNKSNAPSMERLLFPGIPGYGTEEQIV